MKYIADVKIKIKQASAKAILSFFVSMTLCSILVFIAISNKINADELIMEQLILDKSIKIKEVISKLLHKTQALSALVIHCNGIIEDFDRISAAIIDDPCIQNMLIAPDGIVSAVYPMQGNEAVIGLNFFEEGAGNKEAVMAKESGQLVFGGPFDLVQGGKALVGRLPVYIDTAEGNRSFWGLVSVTLKYPSALDGAELESLENMGLSFAIWRVNPDDNKKQIIAGSENFIDGSIRYIEKHIRILNADWYFCIAPVRRWYEYAETWLFLLTGFVISLMLGFITQRNIELRRTKSELEINMYEMTLLTEELSASKILADEANKAKSLFLANMSHEIRTPMNGILGFTDLAIDDDFVPKKTRDYLHKIKVCTESLLGVVNNILDISKIESGKVELEKTSFNINDTLSICRTINNPIALDKGISLSVSMNPEDIKNVLGDPTKLRQVLLNLLSNAIKFTKEGFVSLNASTQSEDERHVTIRFEVQDSGIGLSPKQMESIFEPFTQADISTTRKYGGTGLGLAIAKNLVELMGGVLMGESIQGLGSVFSFTLVFEKAVCPCQTAVKGDNENATTNKLLTEANETPLFQADILVCEDNEINQLVIQEHLGRIGINPTIAPDGEIGVELAELRISAGNPFDLIFMDIQMPVMDGIRAAERLKEIGNRAPIIALTASVIHEELKLYKKHGMIDYLCKPFKTQELRDCLNKYLTPCKK